MSKVYENYDVVVEIDRSTGRVVWEWRIVDHLVQQRDPNAGNYGEVKNNPELLNIDAISTYDWNRGESFMINGMDYNAALDQIVLSIRKISEIVIIDHSTTSEEAAGHSGGKYGRGGDILYRWGNPQNYERGDEADRELYFQHNPNWIRYGEHKDKIIVFNNGLTRPVNSFGEQYSSVDIIDPHIEGDGKYPFTKSNTYFPDKPDWRYVDTAGSRPFYSGYRSGARVLPNGNVYITSSSNGTGHLFEVTTAMEKVWEYISWRRPCRTEKYSSEYEGLRGQILIPQGVVEVPPSTYPCELYTSTKTLTYDVDIDIRVRSGGIDILNHNDDLMDISFYSIEGKLMLKRKPQTGEAGFSTYGMPQGVYLLIITSGQIQRAYKVFLRGE